MKINEVAKLTGITVRTLHYYDKIGLLSPSKINKSGYRIYDNDSLSKLQQILFFKELDFKLSEIKKIMDSPNYNKNDALLKQKEILIAKKDRLSSLITLIENITKGDNTMKFDEFSQSKIDEKRKAYAKEVKQRYGNTNAYKENVEKTGNYDDEKWNNVLSGMDNLIEKFSNLMDLDCSSSAVQKLVSEYQEYITNNFYSCDNEMLSNLGQMYICDERFTNNIDKHKKGTALFMSKAIKAYCSK